MLSIVGTISVVVSLLLVAWQTHGLSRQTRLQTQVAIATSGDTAMSLLSAALTHLVNFPECRPFFYDGVELEPESEHAGRVKQIAELLADAVNSGCESAQLLPPSAETLTGFGDYGEYLLVNSPAFRDLVSKNNGWYPALAALL